MPSEENPSAAYDTPYHIVHVISIIAIYIPFNSVLPFARIVVWIREAHDGSYSVQRFAIALKYWTRSLFFYPFIRESERFEARMATSESYLRIVRFDSIIRSIWFVRFCVLAQKRRRKKNYGGYSNGVDLCMLRLLTMPIVVLQYSPEKTRHHEPKCETEPS